MEEIRKAPHLVELRKDPRYSQLVKLNSLGPAAPGVANK